ncbi:MAG: GIY-YIG nuclease family protein [Candidatus Firestonebacteria bacterium]
MWYVYIIKCSDKSLYTGITNDVARRVKVHNSRKGGKYTRSRLPVKLLYKEICQTKSEALKREIKIKSLSRKEKLELLIKSA